MSSAVSGDVGGDMGGELGGNMSGESAGETSGAVRDGTSVDRRRAGEPNRPATGRSGVR
jgi:hypothetical protein